MTTSKTAQLLRACSASVLALCIAPVLGLSTSANAQEARSDDSDEIIVTAQKRDESIMDVPISITAYSGEQLETMRAQEIEDVLLNTPGVQYVEYSDLLRTVSIRGLNDSGGGLFQTASVTVDGATLIQTYNGYVLASRLFDVERMEVLRGPQGTLTGGSSTSGTINIITNAPDLDEFEAIGTFDFGRFNTQLTRGVFNVPLTDELALRAVGYMQTSDGALRNRGPSGGGSTEDHFGVRVAARWQPIENFTVDVSYNSERLRYGAPNAMLLLQPGYEDPANDGQFWAETMRRNVGVYEAAGGDPSRLNYFGDADLNGMDSYSDVSERTNFDIEFATVRGEYEFANHILTGIFTHYEAEIETLADEDKTELALLTSSFLGGPESDYAEVRINSDHDGSFNWLAGVSYAKERRVVDLRYDITDAFWPYYFGAGPLPDPEIVRNGPYYPDYWDRTLEQIATTAAFTNIFWDITDRIHLSAGARYSVTETATEWQFDPTGVFAPFNNQVEGDESHVDSRVALNFDLTDDVTVYAQYATGYRAGYGNTGPAVDAGAAPAQVDGETVINYELGLKGRFFDGRARILASAFFMDYQDMQVAQLVDLGGSIGLADYDDNVGSASAYGAEFEAALRLTDELQFGMGVSYVESSIDEYEDIYYTGDTYYDLPFPGVGNWNVNAALDYRRDISETMWSTARASYTFRDGFDVYFPWVDYGPVGEAPSYSTVDAQFGVHTDNWSAVAYMENVFDEVYWQGAYLDYSPGVIVPYNARAMGVRLTLRN